jgi:hypothetical protein
LTVSWVAAAKLPSVIVTTANTWNNNIQSMPTPSSGNATVNTRNISAKPAAFDADERNAVTGAGAPSYASGAQNWNGTLAVLNANPPATINTPTAAIPETPSAPPTNAAGSRSPAATSERINEPVAPYSNEIPNANTAEESAPIRKYFTPPSTLPSLVFRNPTNAYEDSDASSNEMNAVARELAVAINAIPVAASMISP